MHKLFSTLFLGTIMLALNSNSSAPVLPEGINQISLNNPIKVEYTNYRGEKGVRTIVPISFFFGTTQYHPEAQWLVKLWDCDRQAERIYALKEITRWFAE
jgi:hypothetical protein